MSLIPQLGFFEIILIAALALIIVGPKDLPRMAHSIGRFVRQAQTLAREFMSSFDQMARETELEEMRKEIEDLKKHNPITEIKNEIEKSVTPISDAVNGTQSDQSGRPSGE